MTPKFFRCASPLRTAQLRTNSLNRSSSALRCPAGSMNSRARLLKRAREFIDPAGQRNALEDLFKLFVLNCAVRNGDAHLKNFGVIYEDVTGAARLAPVYDLVSTVPYLPK